MTRVKSVSLNTNLVDETISRIRASFFLTAVKLKRKTKVKEFSDNEMKKTMRKKLTLEMPHQKTMVTIFATIKRQTRMK